MIKLLLTILFFIFFLILYFSLKKRDKDKGKPESDNTGKKVIRIGRKPRFNATGPLGVTPQERVILLNPVYYGKTFKKKKINFLHISKSTRKKHKRTG